MSVQGHYCLLIELKLCNVITCIGGKLGAEGELGAAPSNPSLEPRCICLLATSHKN